MSLKVLEIVNNFFQKVLNINDLHARGARTPNYIIYNNLSKYKIKYSYLFL